MSAQTVTIDGFSYTIDLKSNEASLSFADGKEWPENIVIPESVLYEGQQYPVVSINSCAFEGCSSSNITSLTIPNSIHNLGGGEYELAYAFYGLSKLQNINVDPENQTYSSTGGVLFNKSKTSLLYFPCGKAGNYEIPNGITAIGAYSFRDCTELTNLSIPNTVLSIGYCAISGCSKLKTLYIPSSVKTFEKGAISFDGDLYVSINSIEEWLTNAINENLGGKRHLIKDDSELTVIKIPNSLPSINYYAFAYCDGIESVEMPSTITSISNYAFYECSNLANVKFSDYVSQIGSCSFYGCSKLTQLDLPNSLTVISSNAFANCSSVTKLTIPNNVTSIENYAFSGCSGLTSLNIPNSVTSIGSSAFSGCSGLTSLNIPNSVTSISSSAFSGCSGLKSVNIPNSVTSIGSSAFSGCSGLKYVNIPNSVTSIGSSAFSDCSGLTSIVIPALVTKVEDYTFQNCSSLTAVELPENLTAIKTYAFDGCKTLESMTLPSGVTMLGDNFISHCKDLYAPFEKIVKTKVSLTGTLHVPNGATSVFTANGWSATRIYDDIDVRFVIASGTHGTANWELAGNTLTILSTYGTTAKMTSSYTTYGSIEYEKYPWYEYRSKVKHVEIRGFSSIGEACLRGMDYLESLTTSTTVVSLYKNETTNELFTCFGKSYQKDVYEYYSTGSVKVGLYKFLIPSTLSKIVYTGETFNMNYFSGGVVRNYEKTKTDEFHPTKPFEILANNVTSVETAGTKSLKNTKVYITYTGNLTSGLFRDMGDLYSLTLNGTGVATEGGAFYSLFGNATHNQDMMYGGGGYYIPKNLKELHLMEDVTSIPEACFKNVTSLEKVYLPSTLRGVQDNAFLNCDGLTDIYVNAAMPPSAKDNSFDGVNVFLCTLHVPYDSKQYYSVAKGWKDFYTIDNDADIKLTILKNIENAGQIIGTTSYMNGETTNITAVANGGYKFVEWADEEGNRISDKPVLSVVATISCIYRAIFVPVSNTGKIECIANGNSIKLNWDTNPQVSYYKIQLYTSSEMEEAVKEIDVDANGTIRTRGVNDGISVEISDLESCTSYYYRIVGYDSDENIQDVYIGTFETTEITHIYGILGDENTVLGIYNVRGEKIPQMTRGINIIRMKNGTTKKIIIK